MSWEAEDERKKSQAQCGMMVGRSHRWASFSPQHRAYNGSMSAVV